MAQTPGWFPDPFGRFQHRYHDGEAWTAQVANDGVQQTDPMGTSTVVPFAQPRSTVPGAGSTTTRQTATGSTSTGAGTSGATPPAATTLAAPGSAGPSDPSAAQRVRTFLDSMGPRAREREAPNLHAALAGVGGAIAAVGLVTAIVRDSSGRGLAALAGAILIAAGLALRLWMAEQRELRAAGVGLGVIGIAAIGVAIVGDNLDGAAGFLVIGVLYLAGWMLPGFRGCSIMLGLGALALVFALGSATSSTGRRSVGSISIGSVSNYQGAAFLVAAAGLLGLVFVLDRHGYHGVATSLVVAALISTFVGAASTVSQLDDTGGTLLIILVGLAVCAVGSHGRRRATTWYGVAIASVGVVAFLAAAIEPSSQGAIAAVAVAAGVILIGGPIAVTAFTANRRPSGAGPSTALPPPTQ